MADDRDRQVPEENDEIGRAADEDVNATAAVDEDDGFNDDDDTDEEEEEEDVEKGE